MPYKFKTQHYRIPVMGEGDMLTEEQEWVQMSTIDNLLHASMFGCTKAYLEEGTYSLEWNESHNACHLHVKPAKEDGYSLLGIINGRLFSSVSDISVGTLYKDAIYHVYIEYQNGLETDAQYFSVNAYIEQQKETDCRMKLCVVDTIEGEEGINTDVNKIYAKNILAHTMDTTNPHGRIQTQDELHVKESLTVKNNPVHGVVFKQATTAGANNVTEVTFDSEPLFLTIYPENLGSGEIAWMIEGNVARIYNSGMEGITLNIKADMK